jgi:PAS domain S-box-containing protein
VPRWRSNGLVAAGLAIAVLPVAHRSLVVAPDPDLVARWWVATAVATVAVLLTPRQRLAGIVALLTTMFLVAGLWAGRGIGVSVGLSLANVVEAVLVVWWLTGFEVTRPGLRTWRDYRRWVVGIVIGCLASGAITALTLSLSGGHDPWRPLMWVAVTHFGTQAITLPLLLTRPLHRAHVTVLETLSHAALFALGAVACLTADASEPVAFLMLPLLMWSAARFRPLWADLELFVVAVGLAALSTRGHGPFPNLVGELKVLDIAGSGQAFVALSAVTSIAFSVAMGHLRDSLRTIRENEVQLGQLLDSASGTAFIATDLDGVITWFSPGAELMLGYAASEVVGRATPVPFHEAREMLARAQELGISPGYRVVTQPVEAGAEQDTRDWTYLRKDGSRLSVSLSVTAVRGEDGRPVSYLSVVRDVTDRRAAEQALVFTLDRERETNQRMLELDRAKGEFVSSVSHELRTPLTSIVGYTELLTDGGEEELTGFQLQLVERIDRNAERLLSLVEDLLTLANVEDGSFGLERVPTDLRDVARVACEEVSHAAHKKRIELEVLLPEEPVVIEGDRTHLERLALNLLSNAMKFTGTGGRVTVELTTDGTCADLRVRDTGMGIPIEEQGHLFQRFFRSSLASEHAIQGTGLGLNIVQAIAQAHGGVVDFESEPGVGTTFRFVVPLVPEAACEAGQLPLETRVPPELQIDSGATLADTV